MKLEQLTLFHIRMPLVSPFETSFGRIDHRECIIIRLRSQGLTGWGEVVADHDPGYSYETTGTAWHILGEFAAPLVVGQDVPTVADLHNRLEKIRGHNMSKAGLEMALWDLVGQRDGRSLRRMLGGKRKSVSVGVSVGLQRSPELLVKMVENYVSQGYGRIKIKIKPGHDVADSQAVRAAFPSMPLQVDANSAYDLKTAEALRPLDELSLLLIEQPLHEDDIWEHRALQAQFHTPICLDESITTPRHAQAALEMGACKIINIKPGRLGGLSQGVAVHDLCRARGVPVWCGGMLETGIGRASNLALATLPGFSLPGDISASDRYYARDITRERFTLNADSTIDVPDGPGLGVTINDRALATFALRRETFRAGKR